MVILVAIRVAAMPFVLDSHNPAEPEMGNTPTY
jgi:hypothetical protein